MQSTISILIWTIFFALVVSKATRDYGKPEGGIYKFHIFLTWLLLVFHDNGFRVLGWAIGHPYSIIEHVYVPIGPLQAWFNLFSWSGDLFCSIAAIVIAFALAQRKESARIWLFRALPFFYLFGVTEGMKGIYKDGNLTVPPLSASVAISAFAMAIPYGAMFLFYRNRNVRNLIFTPAKKQ